MDRSKYVWVHHNGKTWRLTKRNWRVLLERITMGEPVELSYHGYLMGESKVLNVYDVITAAAEAKDLRLKEATNIKELRQNGKENH